MAKQTGISWTDATWNAWQGCTQISSGCAYCYMFRDKLKYGQDPEKVVRSKDVTFNRPLKWKEPMKIFTNSWSDVFHKDAEQWLPDFWNIIRQCPQHAFQILTKRHDRILQSLPTDWKNGWDNVWMGVSVEDQKNADIRIPVLLTVPAKIRFLSCEPLLSDLDIKKYLHGIHWVIIGAESGNGSKPKDTSVKYGYRECELEWIENIVKQCQDAGVPVFVKQLGTHLAKTMGLKDRSGADITEFPKHLQMQNFPVTDPLHINPNLFS